MPAILLIEDNPGDARLIQELLHENEAIMDEHTITHVDRLGEAIDLLHGGKHVFDIILSDITLPDSSGRDTLAALSVAGAELPVIFMTGTNDEALALDAIQKGAQDYLLKGHSNGAVLARAIRYATERKKFQAQLSEAAAETRAARQKSELLRQQKRQLLALNKAKDEFSSLASHQLRTPATIVKQYLSMILEGYSGPVNDQVRASVQTAFENNERQLAIINGLLKTAQLDVQNYHIHIELNDLDALVDEVVSHVQTAAALRQQQISVERYGSFDSIPFDRNELYLVLENIVSNASKYSPSGSPIRIVLKMARKKVHISVIDKGVGISQADQKRVFEKFTRINNHLSDTVTGSGLGLYWAQRIIKLHKGAIKITSELDQGTDFTIELPL